MDWADILLSGVGVVLGYIVLLDAYKAADEIKAHQLARWRRENPDEHTRVEDNPGC